MQDIHFEIQPTLVLKYAYIPLITVVGRIAIGHKLSHNSAGFHGLMGRSSPYASGDAVSFCQLCQTFRDCFQIAWCDMRCIYFLFAFSQQTLAYGQVPCTFWCCEQFKNRLDNQSRVVQLRVLAVCRVARRIATMIWNPTRHLLHLLKVHRRFILHWHIYPIPATHLTDKVWIQTQTMNLLRSKMSAYARL